MLKRLLAVVVILSLLLLLPYWWPLLKESVKTVTSEVTGVAQTIEPNTQGNRSQTYTLKLTPQKYQRKYVFEVRYSDQDGNSFCVDGTDPEYVYVHGRMSNTVWARFEAFFKNLFGRASVKISRQPPL